MPDTPSNSAAPPPAKPTLVIGRPAQPTPEELERLAQSLYDALKPRINNGIPKGKQAGK